MTDVRQNFSLIAGDDINVEYGIVPAPSDPPIDLNTANMSWTAYPQVRGVADKTFAVITKTKAAGDIIIEDAAIYTFAVKLASADTMELSGNYFYEIVIIDPVNNNRRRTATIGTMTVIDTANPLNVVAFKSMFPELESVDDGVLQTALDEAALFVDDTWAANDIAAATFFLAGHFAFTAQSASGTGGQPVSSERIGQIAVTYAVTSGTASASGGGYPSLSNSSYGLMYLALMRRNSPGILIV
jgi:hypothetical protein